MTVHIFCIQYRTCRPNNSKNVTSLSTATMTEIVGSILLKFCLGFISDKFRTYGADKLQDGGLTDQKFRDYIVREFDDIKFKLDGLSRKDLSASISFLKQGVQRLQMSFDNRKPSTSEIPNDGKKSQDTTNALANSSLTMPAQQSVTVEDAVALANAIGELKIESKERFESAKESLKKAGEEATRAFHNTALSTNERILATEVRIASGILEHLDDPELAAGDCLHYLEELHNMTAIKEIFSVHFKGGIKSVFKRESRAEIVQTVTMINLIVADFVSTFANRRMGVFDWPMIECGKRVVHPIQYEKKNVRKMREMEITPPWDIIRYKKPIDKEMGIKDFAINSKGDVIGVFRYDNHPQKLDRATGVWQPFCLSPSDDKMWRVKSVAVDDNDAVYVVSCIGYSDNPEATLSIYSSDGKIIHHCTLDFIKLELLAITVTKEKKIIIYLKRTRPNTAVFVCDSNGKLTESFPTCLKSGYDRVLHLFVPSDKSVDKKIIVATGKYFNTVDDILLCAYTEEGDLKKTIKLHPTIGDLYHRCGITFDHVTKNYTHVSNEYTDDMIHVECFSAAAELRNSLFLDKYKIPDDKFSHIVSHTNGAIALVSSKCVLYLRSSLVL